MKFIFKVLLCTLLCQVSFLANEYKYEKTIELSKDEHKKIIVSYGKSKKLFKFRWTLYVNDTLVVLRSYDRIVAQHVLYVKQNRRSIRVDLKPKGEGFKNQSYILIKFVAYDFSIDKAIFKILLSDKNGQVTLEHLENK